ncbi:MAG: hypothetical protein IJG83_02355 [Thermoguttaceae bacterium]|nr:hypothetical protein [Thermoguttaceae bacterium]
MNILGIDLGTTTIEGVILDTRRGIIAKQSRPNDAILPSGGDEDLQDPERIFRQTLSIVDALWEYRPESIALAGQMHGIVYVDSTGRGVSPLYTWRDRRARRDAGRGESFAERLGRLSGRAVPPGYGLATHYALTCSGEVPTEAAAFATIADYVAARMCGLTRPVTEPSSAASLGLFDPDRSAFDREALARGGIDPLFLPEVVPFGCMGRYRGVKVFTPVGDNQASVYGTLRRCAAGLSEAAHLMVGTSSQLSVFSQQRVEIDGLEIRPFPRGGFLIVGAALLGGGAWALLARFVEEILRDFGAALPGREELYARLTASASRWADTGGDGPRVETTFAGTRLDPTRTGAIERITDENFRLGPLAQGFLRGIAEELYGFYTLLPEELRINRCVLAGGGNALVRIEPLRKTITERFGIPLVVPDCLPFAALGAALFAADDLGIEVSAFRSGREK